METARKLLFAAGAALLFTVPAGADVPESERPIIVPLHNWTGAQISSTVSGEILRRMGYNVEYVAISALAAPQGIADGEITYSPEMWSNNLGDVYPVMIENGDIVDIGDLGLDAREGWLYPLYVEEECPGLPAWEAFLDCHELFATTETIPNGRFLDYPSEWRSRAGDLIREQELPFDVVPAGSEGTMIAELNSAVDREAPLVMMFWAPHWVLSVHETGWIDIPEDLVNQYSLHKPRIFKVAWPGTHDEWPVAARFLESFTLANGPQEVMMDLIDNQQQDLIEVTNRWLDDNVDVWQPMVDAAMAGS
ncbi:MAG: ABC transporter substrate-binding protein [bacterium]|nr:ABC transporter substrate-binding protein [bacterium]